jgi:hypothetical protein
VLSARPMLRIRNAWHVWDLIALQPGPSVLIARSLVLRWCKAVQDDSSVVPANAGTHHPGALMFVSKLSNGVLEAIGHGIWVPGFRRDDESLFAAKETHLFLFTGLRFSMNAAMPSERSSSAKVE